MRATDPGECPLCPPARDLWGGTTSGGEWECPGTLSLRATLPLPFRGAHLGVPVFWESMEQPQVRV